MRKGEGTYYRKKRNKRGGTEVCPWEDLSFKGGERIRANLSIHLQKSEAGPEARSQETKKRDTGERFLLRREYLGSGDKRPRRAR